MSISCASRAAWRSIVSPTSRLLRAGGSRVSGFSRRAVDAGVRLITDLQLARAVIQALRQTRPDDLNNVVAWNDRLASRPFPLI